MYKKSWCEIGTVNSSSLVMCVVCIGQKLYVHVMQGSSIGLHTIQTIVTHHSGHKKCDLQIELKWTVTQYESLFSSKL